MAKSDLRIDILGTSFTISTDEDPVYLTMLLEKYRQTLDNVQRISGLKDPIKIAVLTGFLLCDDLEKAGSGAAPSKNEDAGEAELLTLGMISRLDEIMVPGTEQTPAPCSIVKLQNPVKNYEWGSPEWIPALLGQRNTSRVPWAELWMGVNPSAPSRVAGAAAEGETAPLLPDLINEKKEAFLGEETAAAFGKLPYLFKVLAAAKPLSIQAHPSREQAREGFERENREGIPLDAAVRNYKDPNYKPEIICALGPFVAICGFRKIHEICALIGILSRDSEGELKSGFERLNSALKQEEENPYRAFLTALFDLRKDALESLGPFLKKRQVQLERDFPEYQDEWDLCSYLASLYRLDSGIIAPLYLNIMELSNGEALFIPHGVLHAYIHGLGIELMADSDNVLRGGLTSKHVDTEELFRTLNFSDFKPEIEKVPAPAPSWFTYPGRADEFALSVMKSAGNAVSFRETGPSIVIVTQGSAVLSAPGMQGDELIKTGESVFIPGRPPAGGKNGEIVFSGNFTAYAAAPGKTGSSACADSNSESRAADTPGNAAADDIPEELIPL